MAPDGYETPGARARRERHERIWPVEKPQKAKRGATPKPLAEPAEPIPDEVEVMDEQQTLSDSE